MDTIILTEKDFKNDVYCGKQDLTNIQGNLRIDKAGYCRFETYIYARGGISARGGIFAKGGKLEALYGITAGLKIYAKTTIEAGMRIFAGTAPWSWVGDEHKEIKCGKLLKGTIAYGTLIETGLPEINLSGKVVEVKS